MTKSAKFLAIFMAAAFLAAPAVALAGSGGRVGNPKNLRPKRPQKERGRRMRRPPIPEPRMKQPATNRAIIPDPTARKRGGSGYTRRGRYYYQNPKPIYAKRGQSKRMMPPDPTFRKSK
ncbi:MAG: hypothetical protein ABGY42_10405 [bacterium]